MSKNKIHIDHSALQRAIQPGIDRLAQEANATMQATIRKVCDEMSGQPADDVYRVLDARLRAALPSFNWHEDKVRKISKEIEEDTLTD